MGSIAKPVLLAIALTALTCEASQATCVKPQAQMPLGRKTAGCCDLKAGSPGGAGPNLRWVAVSWEGPPNGVLYVVNCDGKKVAEVTSLGYVERLTAGPQIGNSPTIAVTYVSAIGTGTKVQQVALLQYRAGRVDVLWNHRVADEETIPRGSNYKEVTSWRFVEGYSQIETTTMHTEFGKARRLPSKHFCFRASAWRYAACE